MHLTIIRQPSAKGATLSKWFIEGQLVCWGCEDVVRPYGQYVYGLTAIPSGSYRVVIDRSERFSARAGHDVFLPHVLDMPGQVRLFGGRPVGACGVRIHPGNTAADTEGCLLPGTAPGADGASVVNSRVAFGQLFTRMQAAIANHETITLSIS